MTRLMNVHKLKTLMQLAPNSRNRASPATRNTPCAPSWSPPKVDKYPHFWCLRSVLPICERHTNGIKIAYFLTCLASFMNILFVGGIPMVACHYICSSHCAPESHCVNVPPPSVLWLMSAWITSGLAHCDDGCCEHFCVWFWWVVSAFLWVHT